MRSLLALIAGAAPLAGTAPEEREYALREAASPGTADFVGGGCEFAVFILVVAMLVVLVLYLSKEEKI